MLITKALIDIPAKFAGQPPVNPTAKKKMSGKGMWTGAYGLADDVRYYGQWMRDRAFELVGHLYPPVIIPSEHGGGEATVIAWLWARTVQCPNPACGFQMPLARSFAVSTKPGKKVWVEPLVNHAARSVSFRVCAGGGDPPEGTVHRRGARCLVCGTAVTLDYVRAESRSKGLGAQLLAIVSEGIKGRRYIAASPDHLTVAKSAIAEWQPQGEIADNPGHTNVYRYGLTSWSDLFTARQLVVLTTFSDLVIEARKKAINDGASLQRAAAIATYLSFAVDKASDRNTTLCAWEAKMDRMRGTFGRQALPMVWDYIETNPFAGAGGDLGGCVSSLCEALEALLPQKPGVVGQLDATSLPTDGQRVVFSTDPPYYDNIGYADLSDFFYVWLRRSLGAIYPEIFSTLLVPKKQELVATPYRFGGNKELAREFFEEGFTRSFGRMRMRQDAAYPLTVYYAFKQSESDEDEADGAGTQASTGWETMLQGLLSGGFQITGTWPLRSELQTRNISRGSNALASSIVLACRPRPVSAAITTRKDFLASLKKELPHALRDLQKGNIAPVDLAQAAIGPGMAVFSRYKKVLETDGTPMEVRTALSLINQGLDEVLSEQESEFDPDTRWALAWFEQHQFDEGPYGEAEVLATAKALSISHLAEAGILHSRAGKVRLLRRDELPEDWDPSAIGRLTVWEVTQHLIRHLDQKGEVETANLKAKIGGMAEVARDLAYRLYTLCERKGWAEEAGYYNSLVVAWPSMASEAFELT